MGFANPKIHIICGYCGSNKSFTYSVDKEIDDDTDEMKSVVYIYCSNCGTVTNLNEVINEKIKTYLTNYGT